VVISRLKLQLKLCSNKMIELVLDQTYLNYILHWNIIYMTDTSTNYRL